MPLSDVGYAILAKDEEQPHIPALFRLTRWHWWLLVGLNIFFVVAGQTVGVLLGRFYYDQGGACMFMATIVQTAGFPILFIPLILLPGSRTSPAPSNPLPSKYICLIYVALGIVLAGDNLLYSYALLYLSASTFSLICSTQLAFNAIFSYFINSQKFTPLILNGVVILSYSAALLGVNSSSDAPEGVTESQYAIGFVCAIGASALFSLLLSLTQLTFEKALKRETFATVLEMQMCTSTVATSASVFALFASGQWRSIEGEMQGFHSGKVSYVMTLVCGAVCYQVFSVGMVALIFLVSSLFSNVISTVALVVCPIVAVIVFHDNMNGVKIIAMLSALWGFASYIYQNYLDDCRITELQGQIETNETRVDSC